MGFESRILSGRGSGPKARPWASDPGATSSFLHAAPSLLDQESRDFPLPPVGVRTGFAHPDLHRSRAYRNLTRCSHAGVAVCLESASTSLLLAFREFSSTRLDRQFYVSPVLHVAAIIGRTPAGPTTS